ncbi:hypothetical protein IQ269_00545 [Tychonema sp. LEGE 07199]|uniref:hypothetical protein n=1 Tax=unclassified Tychonema TaxID=2642144 RepID=UPI0018808547|nr:MULTISPECIES: hypothetical protein [unclassified Tychonema]MBE9119329.1 hypothetical protein [Tychonema sp. LEGE 07199]MBE9130584.1 hypothetical protein [Tychonema sp. LEGE 07196]
MTEPPIHYRRIDKLKAIAFDHGFTNQDAKQFGKLSKTATWEALLELYFVDGESLDTMLDKPLDSVDTGWTNDGSFPVCDFTQTSTSFLEWVDFGQLVAFLLASAGIFVLAMSMWRQINPLNLFPPVRINIQIGTKL